jgi:arylsulfatase A-like enzyme
MTGRYAHTNGVIGLANRGWSLPESERTTVDYLNDAGYLTINIGGQHERKTMESYRYKQVGPHRRKSDLVSEDVCEFLRKYDAKEGPFYLNVYSQDVHAPWDRPEFQGKYDPDAILPSAFLPNTAFFRKSLSVFYGSISFMDAAVGKIFETLRETGLEKSTLVIFTTDHGISFPRAKSTLYDPGLGTALLMRWPGRIQPGTVCDHLLGNIDLLPTQIEMAGGSVSKEVQGKSFAPALLGGAYTPHDQIFMERNFHDDFDPKRCVRTRTHKLIRYYSEHPRFKLPNEATEEDTSATMRDSGKPRPFEELFDLTKDPNEFNDLSSDPGCAIVLQDLRQRLDGWMAETNDYMRAAREFVHSPVRDAQFLAPPSRPVPPKKK